VFQCLLDSKFVVGSFDSRVIQLSTSAKLSLCVRLRKLETRSMIRGKQCADSHVPFPATVSDPCSILLFASLPVLQQHTMFFRTCQLLDRFKVSVCNEVHFTYQPQDVKRQTLPLYPELIHRLILGLF
jgi:hypothetical protein